MFYEEYISRKTKSKSSCDKKTSSDLEDDDTIDTDVDEDQYNSDELRIHSSIGIRCAAHCVNLIVMKCI